MRTASVSRRFVLAAILTTGAALTGCQASEPERPEYRISQEEYYDKTLAGILGQVGGVLTGYEFISEDPLPDEWFGFIEGPYSGNSAYVSQPENDRILEELGGVIGSDDDYHIDFFNQHILDEHGPQVSSLDILREWQAHDVGDWGGGFVANENMKQLNMLPPQTGQSEFNKFYWVTESYIENDTLGMVAPGMPDTAAELTEKFASVSGEFDTVTWAKFLAASYAQAYFETDARVALTKAAEVLPRDSWPYRIYAKVLELHEENPDDWRWAQAELRKVKRLVYGWDNIQVIPDINNGLAILSVLYGDNDYEKSARIASLSGYDADCTASYVMGLLGIVKGMDGTPQAVKDAIYQDGEGIYYNDMNFTPHIKLDYPERQKFTDIAKLYQSNAERMIVASGGAIENGEYVIRGETVKAATVIPVENGDFELGDLTGWNVLQTGGKTEDIYAQDNGTALQGDWNGRVDVSREGEEARLFVKLQGLKKGQTYRVQAYVTADDGADARLYVSQGGQPEKYASVTNRVGLYASRVVDFKASGSTAEIGLHLIGQGDVSMSATIDNLTVRPIEENVLRTYDAEEAESMTFTGVKAEADGEYIVRVYYANGGPRTGRLDVYVAGEESGSVWLPQTGSKGIFSANRVEVPVELKKGDNAIAFHQENDSYGMTEIDYIEIVKR